jgi:hypothetical protein
MEAEARAEFPKRVQAMKDEAAKLAACKTETELREAIATKLVDKYLSSIYSTSMKKFTEADTPDDIMLMKVATRNGMIAALTAGEDHFDTTITAEKPTTFETAYSDFEATLYTRVLSYMDAALVKNGTFNSADVDKAADGTVLNKWLFDEDLSAGATKVFYNGDSDGVLKTRSATATVCRIVEPATADETAARNLVYLMFTNSEDNEAAKASANAALALVKDALQKGEEITGESLNTMVSADNRTAYGILENYVEGTYGDEAFDAFAYGEDTEIGDSTLITMDETYHVVIGYLSDGDPVWYVNTREALFTEKIAAWAAEIAKKYEIMMPDYEAVYRKLDA